LLVYSVATWKSQAPRRAIGVFRDENTACLIMMLRRWWPKKEHIPFWLKVVWQLPENRPWSTPRGQPLPANWSASGQSSKLDDYLLRMTPCRLGQHV